MDTHTLRDTASALTSPTASHPSLHVPLDLQDGQADPSPEEAGDGLARGFFWAQWLLRPFQFLLHMLSW